VFLSCQPLPKSWSRIAYTLSNFDSARLWSALPKNFPGSVSYGLPLNDGIPRSAVRSSFW
jgi:hypothetical protein